MVEQAQLPLVQTEGYRRWTRFEWEAEREGVLSRLRPVVEKAKARRSRGEKHPVEDFLWDYYGLRPGRLLHWSPGSGVILQEADSERFSSSAGFTAAPGGGRWLDLDNLREKRRHSFRWIRNLLEQTRDRPPFFGCLGLHEWAMVYEERDIRHPQLPLRLSHAETRRVVETLPVRCSHFDAFRFFSETARPLNTLPLTAEQRPAQEQPACLHANMDLLKWCLKVHPWLDSRLTTDAFFLALRAREADMRASPYDTRPLGLSPIAIETSRGRAEYRAAQEEIAKAAALIRDQLIRVLHQADQTSWGSNSPPMMEAPPST